MAAGSCFLCVFLGVFYIVSNMAVGQDIDNGSGSTVEMNVMCPMDLNCTDLPGDCLDCSFNESCVYGQIDNVTCRPLDHVMYEGERSFERTLVCRYCYQLPLELTCCAPNTDCNIRDSPKSMYIANCTAMDDQLCIPPRSYQRKLPCNFTTGKRWSTAFLLSITVGGFGVDRFYLGHWRSALGKLFLFGGIGVWSIIDVILVATGYLTPEDGSAYVY